MSLSKPAYPFNHPSNLNGLGVDLETAALIAKLALEDLESVYGRRSGKYTIGAALSDEEYAYQLQAQQYREWITAAEDARLAVSLDDAYESDAAYLEAVSTAEMAARDDRNAALALSRGQPLPPPTPNQTRLEDPTFKMHPESKPISSIAKSKAPASVYHEFDDLEDSDDSDDDDATLNNYDVVSNQHAIAHKAKIEMSFGSSSVAGPSIDRSKPISCLICTDRVTYSSALQTPCGHHYCRTCIRDLIQTYTRDESLHPLRCCQTEIPINSIERYISPNLKKIFDAKHAEFNVLAKDRIYCCRPTCSAFLGSSVGREHRSWVICTTCVTLTCPRCKEAAHPNDPDCGVNKSTVELRALAQTQGWQTCPGCQTLVELYLGCYHMTCRCRTQFCYLCAVPWKGCTCPQWDENRLISTAEQRVVNQFGDRAVQMRAAAPEVFQQRVRRAVENLRVNHNCVRHHWKYRPGGGRCEECHFTLPSYLLICTGCSLLACVRCSRNRL